MTWQPIETAPRDGKAIWVYGTPEASQLSRPHVGCEDIEVAHWEGGGWRASKLDGWIIEPTHWMPLPDPPETP